MTADTTTTTTIPVADGAADTAGACCVVLTAPLSEPDAAELAVAFAALADPVRLRLLSILADAGESCSCDLEAPLGKSQPTSSHHPKALAEAALSNGEKPGPRARGRLVPERFAGRRPRPDAG